MAYEFYNPQSNKINITRSFEVKTVINRTEFRCFDDSIYRPKCGNCNIEIKYGEKCFRGYKNRNNEIVLRNSCYGKLCIKCGVDILIKMTPKKLLNELNLKIIGVDN